MGLAGLIGAGRARTVDLQQMARTTTGTGITSMQLDTACRDGLLIPTGSRSPEAFKSRSELLRPIRADWCLRRSSVITEQVGELDFSSNVSFHHGALQHLAGDGQLPDAAR